MLSDESQNGLAAGVRPCRAAVWPRRAVGGTPERVRGAWCVVMVASASVMVQGCPIALGPLHAPLNHRDQFHAPLCA